MASSKPSKRLHTDSDSDGETTNSTFPHFIVLESLQEKQLTKLNPFVIEKVISGIDNPVSVKKLQNGTQSLLIHIYIYLQYFPSTKRNQSWLQPHQG